MTAPGRANAAPVSVEVCDPAEPEARRCLDAYFAELDRRFDAGFDPGQSRAVGLDEVRPPNGIFLVARLDGEAVGCGALKFHGGGEPAEIKRMWVAATARGRGVGARLLAELETRAATRGAHAVRLDTNRTLREAIAMYRSRGYVEIPAFNDEPYAHHWFEKRLD